MLIQAGCSNWPDIKRLPIPIVAGSFGQAFSCKGGFMGNVIAIVILLFLLAVFIIGANMLVIYYQKQKIHSSAEKKAGEF
jgi:hypothetical protein